MWNVLESELTKSELEELDSYRDIGFKRKTPARDGGYLFEGSGLMSVGVQAACQPIEVFSMVDDLKGAVEKNGGLDFMQIFESSAQRREVWAVMMDNGDWFMMTREEAATSPLMRLAARKASPIMAPAYA